MGVPVLDLTRQYASIRDEVEGAVREVFETQHFILGQNGASFEKNAPPIWARPTPGCASGTDAILLGLRALGL